MGSLFSQDQIDTFNDIAGEDGRIDLFIPSAFGSGPKLSYSDLKSKTVERLHSIIESPDPYEAFQAMIGATSLSQTVEKL